LRTTLFRGLPPMALVGTCIGEFMRRNRESFCSCVPYDDESILKLQLPDDYLGERRRSNARSIRL
jgi:hypothetical protein